MRRQVVFRECRVLRSCPVVPLSSKADNNCGMAVISLDLASVLRCASTRLLALAQAETMCTIGLPSALAALRKLLPSMATTSPAVNRAVALTQSRKPFPNSTGSERQTRD